VYKYLQANQKRWDQLTVEHETSAFKFLAHYAQDGDAKRAIPFEQKALDGFIFRNSLTPPYFRRPIPA
jgi:hypothetical protein